MKAIVIGLTVLLILGVAFEVMAVVAFLFEVGRSIWKRAKDVA